MGEFRKGLLWFALWQSVAALLGWIALREHSIVAAFLCGALFTSALWDLSDHARADLAKATALKEHPET